MKITQLILLTICLAGPLRITAQQTMTAVPPPNNLMPVPASIQFDSGRLPITSTFQVATGDYSDARLVSAINRMTQRLSGRTGLTFTPATSRNKGQGTLVIYCGGPGKMIPALDENESYQLVISDQQARLTAETVVGALRGLETFLQLVTGDRDGFYLPAVKI